MYKTHVYVDGFNLYYRVIANRKSPNLDCKWLDLSKLANQLLTQHDIKKIVYCSAPIMGNPDKRTRQEIYWRALRTIPNLEIVTGKYRRRKVRGELVASMGRQRMATIYKFEEKDSDVNLAVHLVRDACMDVYETAAIISNDSDLLLAVETVQTFFGKDMVVLNPEPDKKKNQFRWVANHTRVIRRKDLLKEPIPRHPD